MKIAFISMSNLYLCPYINKYLDVMRGQAEYDIIYWNRHGVEESADGVSRVFAYEKPFDDLQPKWKKLLQMVGFSRYVRKIITENRYDGLVILHTNSAILLCRTLKKYYKNRFILDIRDYSMEKNPLDFRIEKGLTALSAVNFISSEGYRTFLPEADYYMVHNSTQIDPAFVQQFRQARNAGPGAIRISFIGLVRFFAQNERLAAILGNDSRFQLNYFGKNADELKARLAEKGYTNLSFTDQFPPEQTLSFYQQTDIINNAYGNHDLSLDYAYSNKLYYAAILGLPILVSPGTYMADIVTKYGIGFVFDLEDARAPEKLYQYYRSINWAQFDKNCDAFCRMVDADDRKFREILTEYISR